ncbi:hypothetical protein D3C81_1740490 [compost metagenome]
MRLTVVLVEVVIGSKAQHNGVLGVVPLELDQGLLLGGKFLAAATGEQQTQTESSPKALHWRRTPQDIHSITNTSVWLGFENMPMVLLALCMV